ncbi:MAG: helix-turn-helix transcriptional regulator [Bryobacteraceae bacterium]
MATKLSDKIKSLPPARRKKIEERTAELIAEEMSLRELRKAHGLAQERLAEILGIGQEGVSRLEKRSDLLISTLRSYVEAMGGSLSLVAEFPERQPVIVSGLASMETTPARRRTPRRTAPPRRRKRAHTVHS